VEKKELKESKKIKSSRIIDAAIIGFLIGIIVYSVVKNSWGFLTLIPLFLIYKLVNRSKKK
jgi:hypothetical protein